MDVGIVAPLEPMRRPSEKGSKATVQESDEGNSFPDGCRCSFLHQYVDTGSVLYLVFCSMGNKVKAELAWSWPLISAWCRN